MVRWCHLVAKTGGLEDSLAVKPETRRRLWRPLEKYVSNPLMRTFLLVGLAPRAFALLETTGRRTGKRRLTPVGNGLDGEVFWIVAEHGRRCAYVANLGADPSCRVKVGRHWRTGIATLDDDDDGLKRRHTIDQANGLVGRLDGIIFRSTATTTTTVRINLDGTTPFP